MSKRFKKGSKVIVHGTGQNDGKIYKNVPAIILERDPYFHDFHVQFKNGTEDWILPKFLRKPYQRKRSF